MSQVTADAEMPSEPSQFQPPRDVLQSTSAQYQDPTPPDLTNLSAFSPGFPCNGSDVTVLSTPANFYSALVDGTAAATRRVVWSALYLGTGELERRLVETVRGKLEQHPGFTLQCLLDKSRALRGVQNSVTTFAPLLSSPRVSLALYHSPYLRGLKLLLPERWKEIVSVQHMKLFVFDDNVLVSGANLSQDYFTNRQDRYIMFRNVPQLAEYCCQLVRAYSEVSFMAQADGSVVWPHAARAHPHAVRDHGVTHRLAVQKKVLELGSVWKQLLLHQPPADTVVHPLPQSAACGVFVDELATQTLLRETAGEVVMASGYFNLTSEYRQLLLRQSLANFSLLLASPPTNGFYTARGLAGYIPHLYTLAARSFLNDVTRSRQSNRLKMYEYDRPGWTYHAKGLWVYPPQQTLPSLTLCGSPNFGNRSVFRDTELQFAVRTSCVELRQQLHEEVLQLRRNSYRLEESVFKLGSHRIARWVPLAARFIKHLF